ncbi:MAG: signal peptidase II [Patescibacteria group bacterium]|nr:signal peptidase II [Patescibacteria group bacterium]MCL5411705.1 signal peptidase II [Patescibacteria group bacterium]
MKTIGLVIGSVIIFDQSLKFFAGSLLNIWRNQSLFFGKVYLPKELSEFFVFAILVFLILNWQRELIKNSFENHVFLGLMVGGGISNLIDRIRFGYVIDYLNLRFWPAFNLADAFIVLGMTGLIWRIFKPDNRAIIKKEL